MNLRLSFILGAALSTACATPSEPSDASPKPESPQPESPQPEDSANEALPAADEDRPGLSASACEAGGGHAVGDIGDGAIHRPGYVCPDTGKAPLGTIIPDEGGPIATEGTVCCPGAAD